MDRLSLRLPSKATTEPLLYLVLSFNRCSTLRPVAEAKEWKCVPLLRSVEQVIVSYIRLTLGDTQLLPSKYVPHIVCVCVSSNPVVLYRLFSILSSVPAAITPLFYKFVNTSVLALYLPHSEAPGPQQLLHLMKKHEDTNQPLLAALYRVFDHEKDASMDTQQSKSMAQLLFDAVRGSMILKTLLDEDHLFPIRTLFHLLGIPYLAEQVRSM